MPSGRDYANRLLEEANRTFAPHLSGLQEALQSLRNHLTTSLEQLSPKFEAIKNADMVATGNILSEAIEEVRRRRQQDIALVADFGRDLRKKETQEEILSHLLDAAHRYAPRVALLALRGTHLVGWSSRGYPNETAKNIRESQISCSASPILLQAAGADGVITVPSVAGDGVLSQYVPAGAPTACHLLPMKAMNRTVALLLAVDTGEQHCDVNALWILMDLTGLYLETLALRILHEMKPEETPEAVPRAATVAAPVLPVEPVRPATQIVAEAPPVEPSVLPAHEVPAREPLPEIEPEPAPAMPAAAEEPPVPEEVERPTEEPAAEPAASTVLQPEPAVSTPAGIEPARSQSDADREVDALLAALGASTPAAAAHEVVEASHEAAEPVAITPEASVSHLVGETKGTSEEAKLHADARRFARLLVSEIKLYNEQRLTEGRENRDIYVRLKRDIDKSREMYERRVPLNVSRKFDYFNDEVVRILAENDPAKLGSDYPGPRVES